MLIFFFNGFEAIGYLDKLLCLWLHDELEMQTYAYQVCLWMHKCICAHGINNCFMRKLWYILVVKLAIKIQNNAVIWRLMEMEINKYWNVSIIFLSLTIALYDWRWNKPKGNLYVTANILGYHAMYAVPVVFISVYHLHLCEPDFDFI